jgi:hypothetical protein
MIGGEVKLVCDSFGFGIADVGVRVCSRKGRLEVVGSMMVQLLRSWAAMDSRWLGVGTVVVVETEGTVVAEVCIDWVLVFGGSECGSEYLIAVVVERDRVQALIASDLAVVAQVAAQSALSCSRGQAGDVCSAVLVFDRDRMCFLSRY